MAAKEGTGEMVTEPDVVGFVSDLLAVMAD
jgi:hypothetical protein